MCDELLNLLSLPVSSLCCVCRLCASFIDASSAVNIFCAGEDLVGKINKYLPIAVDEADPFPKTVCHLCSEQLNKFHDLVQKSILFEEHLRRTLDTCTPVELDVEALGHESEKIESYENNSPVQELLLPEPSTTVLNSECQTYIPVGIPCQVCNHNLTNFEQCLNHQKEHVNDSVCVVCGHRYDSMIDLNIHLAKHFGDTLPAQARTKVKEASDSEKAHQCIRCMIALENATKAVEHCKSHRPTDISSYSCVVCSVNISTNSMEAHMAQHFQLVSSPLICEACSKEYPNEKALKYHRCIELRKHKCSQCKLGFQSEARLKFHEDFHASKQTFCYTCKKDFKFESRMYLHVTGAHEGKKDNQFCCDTCGRTFRWQKTLRTHQRTHTNDRPFPCLKCNNRFFSKASLNVHLLNHENTPRFHCLRCNYSAHRKLNLLNHVSRFHKEVENSQVVVQCRDCCEIFPNEADMELENHMHPNSSVGPNHENILVNQLYKCEHCDRCFSSAETLSNHRLLHQDDQPFYRCRLCDIGFNKHDLLVRHRKVHANITSRYTGSLSVLIVFLCDKCGVECIDYSQLLDHKERSNCLERRYSGTIRSKERLVASRLRPLKAHQLNVNADGLYECLLCHRTYKNRRRYRLHLATHNS